jgi:hypothetical protein
MPISLISIPLSLTSYLHLTPLSFPLPGPQIGARWQRVPRLGAAAGVAARRGVASSASGLGPLRENLKYVTQHL